MSDALREELAALEHRQWVEWSKSLAESEDLSDERVERWEEFWCPYDDLDEETKDHDRKWADEVLEILDDKPQTEI